MSQPVPNAQVSLAQKGLQDVRGAFTLDGNPAAPNAGCVNFMWLRSPMPDPIDRWSVGDVRRFNDGLLADKVFVNVLKVQAAVEALRRAGVADPYAALAKNQFDADAMVPIGTDGGDDYTWSQYAQLPVNKQVPWGAALSVAPASAANPPQAGQVVTTFPNGVQLIGGGSSATAAASSVSGGTNVSLARAEPGKTADPSNPAYDPASFAGQLDESGDVIRGLSLFDVPRNPFDIANLGPSGAEFISAINEGDVMNEIVAGGGAQAVSSLDLIAPIPGLDGNGGGGGNGQTPNPQQPPIPQTNLRTAQASAGLSVVGTQPRVDAALASTTTAAPFVFTGPDSYACGSACGY